MMISKFRLSNIAIQAAAGAIFAVGCVGAANATTYMQGFEVNTADWNVSNSITRTNAASPGPSSGSWYADITNQHGGSGYGDGGYTLYGGRTTYTGATTQSLDIYIDTSWAAPTTNVNHFAFQLDMAPANATGAASNYAAESNFRFVMDDANNQVLVQHHNRDTNLEETIATLTSSGWYKFEMVFSKGASATDPILTTLNVYDATSLALLASVLNADDTTSYGTDYQSQYLGSGGYAWLTTWQNGFAGDVLHIDNANQTIGASATPLPAALPLFASGLGGLGLLGWRRKRKKAAAAAAA